MIPISEIFTSIDGEVNFFGQGTLTTFIRVAGCNLKCWYCDTKYAQNVGTANWLTVYDILNVVTVKKCPKVTITGGEPLLYGKEVMQLVDLLLVEGIKVSVETNGTYGVSQFNNNWRQIDSWVFDVKFPDEVPGGQIDSNNLVLARQCDWFKHVITGIRNYQYSKRIVESFPAKNHAFSFVHSKDTNRFQKAMIKKMIQDELFNVKVNVQIHKTIGCK